MSGDATLHHVGLVQAETFWDVFTGCLPPLFMVRGGLTAGSNLAVGLFAVKPGPSEGFWEVFSVTQAGGRADIADLRAACEADPSITGVFAFLTMVLSSPEARATYPFDYHMVAGLTDARGDQWLKISKYARGRAGIIEAVDDREMDKLKSILRSFTHYNPPRHEEFGPILARGGDSTRLWGNELLRSDVSDMLGISS